MVLKHNYFRGFNLIEITVAVFIFSVVVLGYNAMHIKGIADTHNNYKRQTATNAADDLNEFISQSALAAPDQATYDDIINAYRAIDYSGIDCSDLTPIQQCINGDLGDTAACDSNAIADFDAHFLFCAGLNGSQQYSITFDDCNIGTLCVNIGWNQAQATKENCEDGELCERFDLPL